MAARRSAMNTSEIKEYFKNDRFADMVGIEIDSIAADEVVCSLHIEAHHLNAGNKVQGGAIFTLADYAFAVACNYDGLSQNKKTITVGHACNITYFNPATGTKLIAKSECMQKGRKLSVFRVTVTDDKGTNIAEMTCTAYTVNLEKR